MTWVWKREHG